MSRYDQPRQHLIPLIVGNKYRSVRSRTIQIRQNPKPLYIKFYRQISCTLFLYTKPTNCKIFNHKKGIARSLICWLLIKPPDSVPFRPLIMFLPDISSRVIWVLLIILFVQKIIYTMNVFTSTGNKTSKFWRMYLNKLNRT